MRKTMCAVFSCCLFFAAQSQEKIPSLAVATIPAELKKDAEVVYRLDEGILNVLSPSEYTLSVHQVVTLLNAEGSRYLHHRLGIDKFNKVEEVVIKMFDAAGLPVKTYGKKEFETEAAFDGISLVNDDKVMKLYTPAPEYPCTVDVKYKLRATGYIELPNWFIDYHDASTEVFRYEVTVPATLDIRHRTLNIDLAPRIETSNNQKRYLWEAKNIGAKKVESEGFEPARYLPQIEVSPNEFSYDGYKGSFRSWSDFGKWNYTLYEENTPFTSARINEIKSLVTGATTKEEKIRTLYYFLQQNMRYVSIQLGIGGFKPFPVKFVDEKKYGDCKALTNYMRYLLQTVGITAYPALINAGHNKVPADEKFPTDPFNHVILCIPNEKDTTWLECTSTSNKAGELGSFTENKRALLLTENGGILVSTPKSDHRRNLVLTNNTVIIGADGEATIRNIVACSGEASSFYKYVSQLKSDEQKEMLVKTLHFKDPDELAIVSQEKDSGPSFSVNRHYEKLYEFKAGDKYFFPVCINPLATDSYKLARRETDFVTAYPYEKTDTTTFQFANGFVPESIPANAELKTDFTSFKRVYSYDKATNRLVVASSLLLMQQVIPAAAYSKVAQFFHDVTALEEQNIVLTKQQ